MWCLYGGACKHRPLADCSREAKRVCKGEVEFVWHKCQDIQDGATPVPGIDSSITPRRVISSSATIAPSISSSTTPGRVINSSITPARSISSSITPIQGLSHSTTPVAGIVDIISTNTVGASNVAPSSDKCDVVEALPMAGIRPQGCFLAAVIGLLLVVVH